MNETNITQIELPGMPIKKPLVNQIIAKNIPLGSVVSYTGTLKGGPKFGSLGVVQKTKNRGVLVDMGLSGKWNIHYFFLSTNNKAA